MERIPLVEWPRAGVFHKVIEHQFYRTFPFSIYRTTRLEEGRMGTDDIIAQCVNKSLAEQMVEVLNQNLTNKKV